MNTNNQVLIYGIGGADKAYRVLEYYCIFDTSYEIVNEIWRIANKLKVKNPSIERFFIMNNRRGLRRDYQDAYRADSIEGWFIFRDILEREAREIHL